MAFFLISAFAACLMIGVNQWFVPRADVLSYVSTSIEAVTLSGMSCSSAGELSSVRTVAAQTVKSPLVLAQIYHYAIAAGVTFVLAFAIISICVCWLRELYCISNSKISAWPYIVLPILSVIPIAVAICEPNIVDDLATRCLLALVGQPEKDEWMLLNNDSRLLGAAIFTAFLFAAATTAISAGGSPTGEQSKTEVYRRMQIVRNTLLVTSVLLVCSLAAAKLRLDIGTHLLGKVDPNTPAALFQIVVNAIINYWASVLSVGLAIIYGPAALYLYSRADFTNMDPESSPEKHWLKKEYVLRVIRLVAILAPPIVAAGLEKLS